MFRVARTALNLTARSVQHTAVRQTHHRKHELNFHDKYGNLVLIGGAAFFATVWGYVLTKSGIEWGLSPIGRVTPKEWRE
ncbi:cytochrome c oxidase subunit 7B, mitochondrial [Meleagris gallopavo]|uniref:Cytochrome c oxidase subunit 7B, mitochondrial n=1 Tax=Meleagris gallopavo TaxID=9103 RepID=Q71SZ4_MELGA|nr:cytochrome c oxidase subunit 7B, mitochondrial [Meleagris gallopavo]AAQ14277.1 cytochrome c oxidase subunit VIIb precursor [Meleagris gallopavo]